MHMEINNFQSVKKYLNFSSEGFYVIHIFMREKDFGVPSIGMTGQGFPWYPHKGMIKFFIVKNEEDYDRVADASKSIAIEKKARIYITTYSISYSKIQEHFGVDISSCDAINHGISLDLIGKYCEPTFAHDAFMTTDADGPYRRNVWEVAEEIKRITKSEDDKVILNQTPNGYQIFSPPFTTTRLKVKYPFIYSTKYGMCLLYYNDTNTEATYDI